MIGRNEEIDEHASYGVALITRPTGGGVRLFGAATDLVPSFVEFTVERARMVYDPDSMDHRVQGLYGSPYRDRHIVTFRMSAAQFAELLTNVGMMPGVPVTFIRIAGEPIDDVPATHCPPLERVYEQIHAEAEHGSDSTTAQRIVDARKTLRTIIEDRVPVRQQHAALAAVDVLAEGGRDRAKYSAARVKEIAQKLVSAARTEVHAAMTSVLVAAGRKALGMPEPTRELPEGEG